MIIVRRSTYDEIDSILKLIVDTVAESYPAYYSPQAVGYFYDHHTEFSLRDSMEKGWVYIAEDDGKLIGTGTLLPEYIGGMYVLPGAQGMGIGGKILSVLEEIALRERMNCIRLHSSFPAKNFYLHSGYEIESEREIRFDNGEKLMYFDMIKKM